jgi:hypothetical protein
VAPTVTSRSVYLVYYIPDFTIYFLRFEKRLGTGVDAIDAVRSLTIEVWFRAYGRGAVRLLWALREIGQDTSRTSSSFPGIRALAD